MPNPNQTLLEDSDRIENVSKVPNSRNITQALNYLLQNGSIQSYTYAEAEAKRLAGEFINGQVYYDTTFNTHVIFDAVKSFTPIGTSSGGAGDTAYRQGKHVIAEQIIENGDTFNFPVDAPGSSAVDTALMGRFDYWVDIDASNYEVGTIMVYYYALTTPKIRTTQIVTDTVGTVNFTPAFVAVPGAHPVRDQIQLQITYSGADAEFYAMFDFNLFEGV